ncbi:MAG: hypothetical protein WDN49_12450 [Acetobacteraceae bacterium]
MVDALVADLVSAHDRASLVTASHALDRVLLWGWYMVPQWHMQKINVAYWNRFGHPSQPVRTGVEFNSWWVDPKLAPPPTRRAPPTDGRLSAAAAAARRPDVVRHHHHQLRRGAVRAGGPVEQMLAQLRGQGQTLDRITGGGSTVMQPTDSQSSYRGAPRAGPEVVASIRTMFGFDKPPLERYLIMIGDSCGSISAAASSATPPC